MWFAVVVAIVAVAAASVAVVSIVAVDWRLVTGSTKILVCVCECVCVLGAWLTNWPSHTNKHGHIERERDAVKQGRT